LDSISFEHIGAVGAEFEFQRYMPRRQLVRAIADCDVLQVVCGSPAWANAVLGLSKPVAVHVATRARIERRVRDAHPTNARAKWRRAMTWITDRFDDRALRRADAIQLMNPWMLDYVRGLNSHRDVDIRYAPPGIDSGAFRPLEAPNLSRSAYILCVARLDDPRKNLGLLVDAYARIPDQARARTRLVFAGSAAPPEEVLSRAELKGVRGSIDLVLRPSDEALIELYQGASVFALPSDEEGFGLVLLEAMACGIPVVSTRSGGPEGIITDGKDGFLVSSHDATEMSDRLGLLLHDCALNRAIGQAARSTIETRYAEEIAGNAILDVWDRLVTKGDKTLCAG